MYPVVGVKKYNMKRKPGLLVCLSGCYFSCKRSLGPYFTKQIRLIILFVVFNGMLSASNAQSIARNVIASAGGTLTAGGSMINYNIGETVIPTLSAGGSMITQGFEQPDDALLNSITASFNLTAFLEGFYIDINTMRPTIFDLGMSTDPTETDTVIVNLWSPANLQDPAFSIPAVLHTNGTASVQFPAAVRGHAYYIAVKHRNHMETWSHDPVTFIETTDYDFSTALAQAYDDGVNPPMASVAGGKFAFYGGDVNQDGTVDASDMAEVDNDNAIFAFGYNKTDINGDGATDASDISIVDNNQALFLFYARPY